MPARVAIVGCGLIGHKRAEALDGDVLVACYDPSAEARASLAEQYGGTPCANLRAVLEHRPDIVIVATPHDQLAGPAQEALAAGAHVLVEKPAGLSVAEVEAVMAAADAADRRVKVGFNHRFHPAIARAVREAHSGDHGDVLHVRARYGHGGRPGYDREWRAEVRTSGGGEIVDQGMHLLDLSHWIMGPLPFNSGIVRTQFWDTDVDDNAALLLGERQSRTAPWSMLHVSWTEWKNMFSLEIYCRTAKLTVDGLVRSYGPQTLRVYRMGPDLGPPSVEEETWPDVDHSWIEEWRHFRHAIASSGPILGDLNDARYAWQTIDAAYDAAGYGSVRAPVR